MYRRHFLKSISFGIPATAAATSLVSQKGGVLNALEAPSDAEIRKVHDSIKNSPFLGKFGEELADVRDDGLYDALRIAPGVMTPETYHYFTNPIGSPRFNRWGFYRVNDGWVDTGFPQQWCCSTLADTNLVQSNQLPPPRVHLVERILFIFNPSAKEEDIDSFARHYYFEFRLADKIYARAPLVRCSASGELSAVLDCDEAGIPKGLSARNAAPIGKQMAIHLTKPLYIPPLGRFSLNLYGTPFKTAGEIALYAFLDGTGVFPIQ